jgi:PKD repeat protein
MLRTGLSLITVLAATLLAGCTVKETDAPPLAGPSEFALSINMQAVPDSIYQDGASQSAINIVARGPDSQPVRALPLRVETYVDGVLADFGTLSARTVVTGDDGVARLTYTAPPRPIESTGPGRMLTITATPIGGDYRGESARQVDIRLVPPGIILPPPGAPPAASFNFSPTTVTTFTRVTFDASPTACPTCTFVWSFGDGGSATGTTVTHEYRAPGSYVVTLRATDARGQTASTTQSVTVAASALPTANFEFSPTEPLPSQDIFFTAVSSTATPGRRLVRYDWNFGSGRSGSGVTVTKRYDTAGTYVVTLTVTDDANQQHSISKPVPVGVVDEEGRFVGRVPGTP